MFLNATWAADRGAAFGKAALLVGLVLVTFVAVTAAATLDPASLRRAALAFAAGALFGAVFVLVELRTDGAVTRTVMNWLPLLQPHFPKHIKMQHGEVTGMNPPKLNQNVNLVCLPVARVCSPDGADRRSPHDRAGGILCHACDCHRYFAT